MKFGNSIRGLALACSAIVLSAVAPAALAEKYDGLTVTFEQPLDSVQKAAIDALATVGVDVKKPEPNYLEGKRRHKVGAFVGSGGEVLSVSLKAVDATHTEAKVRTTKTFVGRAGPESMGSGRCR
jgi:hypothetical protein